jgi:hypothetical protein
MIRDRQTFPRRPRVPPLLVEQLVLGELPDAVAARVRAELENEPGGFQRLAAIRRSNEATRLEYPPRSIVPAIELRAGIKPKPSRTKWMMILPATLAAAAALALALHHQPNVMAPAESEARETILLKGTPRLVIHRKQDGSAPALNPGTLVRPHDVLQVGYLANGMRFGVIFSLDGRGGVTLHYPEAEGQAQTLNPKGEVPLAHAYELDDAPAFERFFFVAAEAPIDIDAVLHEARSLASHPDDAAMKKLEHLPDGLTQYSFTLRKEAP